MNALEKEDFIDFFLSSRRSTLKAIEESSEFAEYKFLYLNMRTGSLFKFSTAKKWIHLPWGNLTETRYKM